MWLGLYLIGLVIMVWGLLMTCPLLPKKIINIGLTLIFTGLSFVASISISYGINLIINN